MLSKLKQFFFTFLLGIAGIYTSVYAIYWILGTDKSLVILHIYLAVIVIGPAALIIPFLVNGKDSKNYIIVMILVSVYFALFFIPRLAYYPNDTLFVIFWIVLTIYIIVSAQYYIANYQESCRIDNFKKKIQEASNFNLQSDNKSPSSITWLIISIIIILIPIGFIFRKKSTTKHKVVTCKEKCLMNIGKLEKALNNYDRKINRSSKGLKRVCPYGAYEPIANFPIFTDRVSQVLSKCPETKASASYSVSRDIKSDNSIYVECSLHGFRDVTDKKRAERTSKKVKQRKHCASNIRKIEQSLGQYFRKNKNVLLELYNQWKKAGFLETTIAYPLVKEGYIQQFPKCPTTESEKNYTLIMLKNKTPVIYVKCSLHGTISNPNRESF
ncbi:hypothetical protein KAJ27_01955 [bacterium]|nr:hypothetical protein [bacterium]